MNKFLEKFIAFLCLLPILAILAIGLVWIDGPGAADFFARHPVFKWIYYITHFFWGDGLFYIHLEA